MISPIETNDKDGRLTMQLPQDLHGLQKELASTKIVVGVLLVWLCLITYLVGTVL